MEYFTPPSSSPPLPTPFSPSSFLFCQRIQLKLDNMTKAGPSFSLPLTCISSCLSLSFSLRCLCAFCPLGFRCWFWGKSMRKFNALPQPENLAHTHDRTRSYAVSNVYSDMSAPKETIGSSYKRHKCDCHCSTLENDEKVKQAEKLPIHRIYSTSHQNRIKGKSGANSGSPFNVFQQANGSSSFPFTFPSISIHVISICPRPQR